MFVQSFANGDGLESGLCRLTDRPTTEVKAHAIRTNMAMTGNDLDASAPSLLRLLRSTSPLLPIAGQSKPLLADRIFMSAIIKSMFINLLSRNASHSACDRVLNALFFLMINANNGIIERDRCVIVACYDNMFAFDKILLDTSVVVSASRGLHANAPERASRRGQYHDLSKASQGHL